MNSLGIVLIARLGSFKWIADMDDAERNMVLGHLENALKVVLYSPLRICAAPYSAKPEIGRAKENIFNSGGAVLNPKLSRRRRKRTGGITCYDNNERGIKAREERCLLYRAELLAILDNVKLPGGLVASAGAAHCGVKELVDKLIGYLFLSKLSDTSSLK